jgi:hypothetical protein
MRHKNENAGPISGKEENMRKPLQVSSLSLLMTVVLGLPFLLCVVRSYGQSAAAVSMSSTISITVLDVTTGQQISNGETITAGDQFQATVTVTNRDLSSVSAECWDACRVEMAHCFLSRISKTKRLGDEGRLIVNLLDP